MAEPQDKKIIVDEDWKSQVQAEKEAAAKEAAEQGTDTPASDSGDHSANANAETVAAESAAPADEAATQQPESEMPDMPLPDPTLTSLVTVMATQSMIAMGLFPHPATGEANFRKNEAKHFIDTIELIQEKTEGNRSDEESKMIDNTLHELRMTFLAVQQQAASK